MWIGLFYGSLCILFNFWLRCERHRFHSCVLSSLILELVFLLCFFTPWGFMKIAVNITTCCHWETQTWKEEKNSTLIIPNLILSVFIDQLGWLIFISCFMEKRSHFVLVFGVTGLNIMWIFCFYHGLFSSAVPHPSHDVLWALFGGGITWGIPSRVQGNKNHLRKNKQTSKHQSFEKWLNLTTVSVCGLVVTSPADLPVSQLCYKDCLQSLPWYLYAHVDIWTITWCIFFFFLWFVNLFKNLK